MGAEPRRTCRASRRLLHVAVGAPRLAPGHASGFGQSADRSPWRVAVAVLFVASSLAVGATAIAAQQGECVNRATLQVAVTDESGTLPLPGAIVVARWTNPALAPLREATGADGSAVLCVPPETEGGTLWAEWGDESSGQTTVTMRPGETREVTLPVVVELGRRGRIIGRIHDALTDKPVVTAAASVSGGRVVAQSDRRGWFRLAEVPAGQHEIEVRRIGYATLRHQVTVTPGITTELELGLVPDPVEMEPLVATTTRLRRLEIKGFYERRHWGELTGNGYYFGPEYIERWRPTSIGSLVRMNVPGIGRGFTNRRMGSSGFSPRPCRMNYFIDGIDQRGNPIPLLMVEVAAVEVYKGPASLPAEFSGSNARCGAIVVWTK